MSTATIATILLLGVFLVLVFLRVPVVYAIGVASLLDFFYLGINPMQMALKFVSNLNSYTLLAVPFFILMGELMSAGGITDTLIAFSKELVGWMHGGAAMVNVVASFFFGGISGSSSADCASLGPIEIKMMEEQGYDRDYAINVTVTSATQSMIIPPSHNMIVYAMAAGGVSCGRLFLGGIIPGILLAAALLIVAGIIVNKKNYPKGKSYTFGKSVKITLKSLPGLMTIVIILLGVCTGIFTATESAAIAALYAFALTFFVYKTPLKELGGILHRCLRTLGMVLAIIAAAGAFGYCLSYLRVPQLIANGLMSITSNKYLLLLLINIMLLFLGCIMDVAPLIIITTPILAPIATSLGMDLVQFGIMMLLNLAVGACTPPVGLALFTGCAVGKMPMEKVMKTIMPFYIAMFAALMLVTYVPWFSLFLPNLLMG